MDLFLKKYKLLRTEVTPAGLIDQIEFSDLFVDFEVCT